MMYDLSEMERRLAAIDAERDPLVKLIAAAKAYEARNAPRSDGDLDAIVDRSRRRLSQHTAAAKTAALAHEMIDAKGAPVPTRDIVAEMEARGLPLPAKNIQNVISARLSNAETLKGRRDMGWWPANEPWPDESAKRPELDQEGATDGGANVIGNG